MPNKEPTEKLKLARRVLEEIPGYERLGDFYWNSQLKKWLLHVRLTINVPGTTYVPAVTEWRIVLDSEYPLGDISFMPDAIDGIKHTFQHQNYNKLLDNAEWRGGKVCLETIQGSWGRKKYSKEPSCARERLKWYIERCLTWLEAAATNSLVENGDPFELPDFPSIASYSLVFNEDDLSFAKWKSTERKSGLFIFYPLGHQSETYILSRFDIDTEGTAQGFWGSYVNKLNKDERTGTWLMLNRIPIVTPWQMPDTFIELRVVCQEQGIDLTQIILKTFSKLQRKLLRLNTVALGFPVTSRVGLPDELVHWFAFELLPPQKRGGYRNNEALWKQQITALLNGSNKIKWIKTENWNRDQLTNRGRVAQKLVNRSILFIGAGSLGATFAELFGRLGCSNLTIVDYDKIQAGNLSRHTLTMKDVGMNKAEALSAHLNSLFPFHRCTYRKSSIEGLLAKEPTYLNNFDVVIDATAEDAVIPIISNHLSPKTAHFFSISTGFNADRLYCFMSPSSEFINLQNDFKTKIDPHLQQEASGIKESSEIIEGIGCWHPLFPARIDDIQMLAGAAFKAMERQFSQPKGVRLALIEKQYDDSGEFTGVTIKNV